MHKLEDVTDALEQYSSDHGELPQRVHTTHDGKSEYQHSWRALLLPYLTTAGSAVGYDLNKSPDDPENVAAARRVSKFSPFAGMVDACVFRISDAELADESEPQLKLEGRTVAVGIPFQKIPWSSLEDVTSEQVWKIASQDPEIVFVGLKGGCIIRLMRYVTNREECVAFLTNREELRSVALKVHERIISSRSIAEQDKQCSKNMMKIAGPHEANTKDGSTK